MTYRVRQGSVEVVRIADSASISNDPGNADRIQYQQWLDAGNIPESVPEPEVPYEVKRRNEYIKEDNSLSLTDTLTVMIEAIIDELNARGEGVTSPFRRITNIKTLVNDKVRKPGR